MREGPRGRVPGPGPRAGRAGPGAPAPGRVPAAPVWTGRAEAPRGLKTAVFNVWGVSLMVPNEPHFLALFGRFGISLQQITMGFSESIEKGRFHPITHYMESTPRKGGFRPTSPEGGFPRGS